MFRMKSVYAATALALMIGAATMAYAQGSSTTPSTSSTPAATTPAAPAKTHTMHAKTAAMAKTDINSASKEDLMKLPGVGDATADKIIAARPFKMKSQLVSKGIVTKAEYAKLAAHVIAKSEAKK
jgi:competence protein ComEA